ncbi:hypothetical protein HUJ05_009937 [Dendroctonus ponderosae]|nr:hypothetical protein HUJ05_009937 [Dendroctonus ponderosae]
MFANFNHNSHKTETETAYTDTDIDTLKSEGARLTHCIQIDPFFLTQLAQCLLFSSIEFVNTQIYYQKDKNDTKSLIRNSLMGLSRMHLNPYSYVCLFLCLLQKSSTLLRSEVKHLKY